MAASLLGDLGGVAGAADADHGLPGEAELHGIGDGDDLHDAGVDHALHALAHGGLGQADRLADARIRPAAVLLQLLDDRLGEFVELERRTRARMVDAERDGLHARLEHPG